MKKLLLLLAAIGVSTVALSQRPTVSMKNFDMWSVTASLGAGQVFGDLSDNKSQFNLVKLQPIGSLVLSKQLSHFFSLEAGFTGGSLSSSLDGEKFTTNFSQLDGRVRFNLTNGQIIPKYRNTQLFAYVGLGMTYYDVQQDSLSLNQDWIRAIPIGAGAKHKISDKLALSLDFAYTRVNTDNFDGIQSRYSENDGYARATVGIQYMFGKKKKLEWDIYTDYYRPLDEHAVDTIVFVKRSVDTLVVKMIPDSSQEPAKNTVFFDFNKWDIKNKYFDSLDDLALKLLNGEIENVVIEGHTDSVGTDAANLIVSQRRAQAIEQYLISKGVDPKKISKGLYGPTKPTSSDRDRNRRVELH